jgi:transcriptional regulator with XRE-family HTH domain
MSEKAQARAALRDFLVTRRARVTPEQAGLRAYGTNRRVKGLRREEVAMLAGISTEYYTRLERGLAAGASMSVIEAVASVLQLNTVEREHFARLLSALDSARPAVSRRRRPARGDSVRPPIQRLLDSMPDVPAFVINRRLDIVACNRLGRLLYAPILDDPRWGGNQARFVFLAGDRAREFWLNWEEFAEGAVAVLRTEAGRNPHHPALVELIGQLSTGSDEFRVRWAHHNVHELSSGMKTLHHPLVGTLTMPYENFDIANDDDLLLMAYLPEPGSPAHDSLKLLSSWDTTHTDTEPHQVPDTTERRTT